MVIYFRDNVYIIKTLKEFQYLDEDGKDQGANVRQKAKDITNLLLDESRLREERRTRASMRDRMIRGGAAGYGEYDEAEEEDENRRRRHQPPPTHASLNGKRPPGGDKDEDELRKAIEESKKSFSEEHSEEKDLQRAIRLSEEEEAKRRSAVENSNASALFDDQNQLCVISYSHRCFVFCTDLLLCYSPNPNNNPFPLTDPTPYAVGLQPQFTSIQPQFTQVQPQFTSFNPYQQQAEQEAAQVRHLTFRSIKFLIISNLGGVHSSATTVPPAAAAAAT